MIIIPGSASKDLGTKVATVLNLEPVFIQYKIFPDGESYIRFTDELKNKDVVIIQSCSPPQDKNLIELLLMLDNAKDLGARSITAIVPYLAYSRQDRRFMPFEAISIKTIAKLIESTGTDEIITLKLSLANLIYRGIKGIESFQFIRSELHDLNSVTVPASDPYHLFQDISL
ncbi:MAG: ribose-phosphate diphosphokinase, partial [Candidatus Bathyarchaeia archaeon]